MNKFVLYLNTREDVIKAEKKFPYDYRCRFFDAGEDPDYSWGFADIISNNPREFAVYIENGLATGYDKVENVNNSHSSWKKRYLVEHKKADLLNLNK